MRRTPVQRSIPNGRTWWMAFAALSGRIPPAMNTGRDTSATPGLSLLRPPRELLDPRLGPARIEQESVDRGRTGPGLVERFGAGDVDHLDDFHPGHGPAQGPVGRWLDGVDDFVEEEFRQFYAQHTVSRARLMRSPCETPWPKVSMCCPSP